MKSKIKNSFRAILLLISIGTVIACSSQKNTAINRGLQNLSARYNYIYNSGVLLTDYENAFALSISDTYEEILPVYLMPKGDAALADKSLISVISKAQAIIAEKNVSNYLDDAYILLGKANYYQGNFFTATEYFDYVAKNYPSKKLTYINALAWKARSQYMLSNFKNTAQILDTVTHELDSVKKHKAEALATMAQLNIHSHNYPQAIDQLKLALKQRHSAQENSRWQYIIGQLYESEKNYPASLDYYNKVAKSNAAFEMYFHANLNRIRVNGLINGERISKQDQLLALLKDDKNEEYVDQIYFKVAEGYAEAGDFKKAEENYLLSISKSTKNQYQKGLSYLRVADINFKTAGDYLKAKAYYDSAVTTLPKTYPGYDAILKKGQNLQYLADRFKLIAFQDTLQMLALLPEADRLTRINKITTPVVPVVAPNATQKPNTTVNTTIAPLKGIGDPFAADALGTTSTVNSSFYFNNATALSNGLSDFKRKWGNRPLQDNWRQGTRTSEQTVTQNQTTAAANTKDSTGLGLPNASGQLELARQYLDAIPSTPALLEASNQKIINAYLEIANYYLQDLNDKKEAARIYELILKRFPDNKSKETIYYSLYRAYQGVDEAASERYKQLVLTGYPASLYAKTILDPSYSAKASALERAIQRNYDHVYAGYENKQYDIVISEVDQSVKAFTGNPLLAQFAYLRSIAIGRTNNVDSLLIVFNEIITRYPDDKVITPLVKDHIAYINKNIYEFRTRKYALIDFDVKTTRFNAQNVPDRPVISPVVTPVTETPKQEKPAISPPVTNPPVTNPPVTNPPVTNPPVTTPVTTPVEKAAEPEKTTEPEKPSLKSDGTFTNAPSSLYYYVIYVNDASLTLSSSRFGVGQFNRGNFPDNNLRHQLTELDEDQLIYVGNFTTIESVRQYEDAIKSQLSRIMKVPAANYSGFIISKENFDKLQNREKIKQYLTFYKTSY